MNVREWLNNNSAIATLGAVVVLAFALLFLWWTTRSPNYDLAADGYYYDAATKTFFIDDVRKVPPINPPNSDQPSGYRAQLYSCGECPPPEKINGATAEDLAAMNVLVGFLERYDDRSLPYVRNEKPLTDAVHEEMGDPFTEGQLVKRLDDANWVYRESMPGFSIVNEGVESLCAGQYPNLCYPGQ